ncbi:FAD-dependent monooxygenase, partial [Streptomyces sp. NPDC007901]|uniref:FAD-dependent monooxygenase n=1 Tax=Streptomyces sp. NPDC007901 TaxID=3364785 RepID=UPI0036E7AC87
MMKQQRRSVLIVGGGIGGLTAAVALCRRGHAVEVVEQQHGWPAVGWGLSLTGPALRALDTIGLAQQCIDAGYPMRGIRNCDTAGKVLHEIEPPSLLG